MVRSLAATRVDLSRHGANISGAIGLANREYGNNMPVLREMLRNLENHQAISSGQPSGQPTVFDGMYKDSMGTVWGADGYQANSTLSQAYTDLDNAKNGNDSSMSAGSLVSDIATTGALTVINPALGAGYGLFSAGKAALGMLGSGNDAERLEQTIRDRIQQYEEIQRAVSARNAPSVAAGESGREQDAQRPDDPFSGEYRMAGTAPRTPQPAMAVGGPAPMMG